MDYSAIERRILRVREIRRPKKYNRRGEKITKMKKVFVSLARYQRIKTLQFAQLYGMNTGNGPFTGRF